MIAELSRARSELRGAPRVRKFSNPCIQEIWVLRKSSLRGTSVRAPTVSCKPGWNFAFQAPAQFPGLLVTKSDSFFRLNFNVWITEKELEREKKKQRRPISLEEKHNNFKAAVRKRGNATCHQGENERQRQKKWTGTHATFPPKKNVYLASFWVSPCSRAKQR